MIYLGCTSLSWCTWLLNQGFVQCVVRFFYNLQWKGLNIKYNLPQSYLEYPTFLNLLYFALFDSTFSEKENAPLRKEMCNKIPLPELLSLTLHPVLLLTVDTCL